ncbi:hypothetical protein AFLA70_276g000781 [Aspergillus flavus AF70]|nr:hypothetical protein AFLA70_276g000781 [Aspergillus flavus AF70]
MPLGENSTLPQIAIIGVGQVGAAAAYALILDSVPSELLLVDVSVDVRDSQVRDLSDTTYTANSVTRVRAATYREASQSDIVVITAGSKYPRGETSLQHMYRKIAILRNIIQAMKPFRPETIILVVANPVDLLTSIAQGLSGLPVSQVMGSGTFLDSVRLRGLLAEQTGVAVSSIDIYTLGVHGDSQVVAWSIATIGGIPIDEVLPPDTLDRGNLEKECKGRSQRIVQGKGAIPFGIGSAISSICSSILYDKRNVRPISHFQPEFKCCFSLPVVLGSGGIIKTIRPLLNDKERADLTEAGQMLRNTIDRINEDE